MVQIPLQAEGVVEGLLRIFKKCNLYNYCIIAYHTQTYLSGEVEGEQEQCLPHHPLVQGAVEGHHDLEEQEHHYWGAEEGVEHHVHPLELRPLHHAHSCQVVGEVGQHF